MSILFLIHPIFIHRHTIHILGLVTGSQQRPSWLSWQSNMPFRKQSLPPFTVDATMPTNYTALPASHSVFQKPDIIATRVWKFSAARSRVLRQ